MLILPIIEGLVYLLLLLFLSISILLRYNLRHKNHQEKKQQIHSNKNNDLYPIVVLERQNKDNGKDNDNNKNNKNSTIITKEYLLSTEEFLLFTMLFRMIREYKPITCKDDLAWYHYVYHMSGSVLRDILNNNNNKNDNDNSTTHIILNALVSFEKNQLYIDYVFNLKEKEFNIKEESSIRGNEKWMIKTIDDLLDDIHITKYTYN
uniref:Wsv021-like protein n=1 Tax=Metapenaeus joyneri majanivirus TaxID=2984280 RepID=A0A9C7EYT6_9VIRU|nr:MAG: wsv021-like protein [Metapenaeus joyneri majanivirus]